MRYLGLAEVVDLHRRVLQVTGDAMGLRGLGALESAVAQSRQRVKPIAWSAGGHAMKKSAAERYRDIDFSGAKRGAVIKAEPGKTKISIRLSNAVLEYFRDQVDKARGGNYQTRINEALLEHLHRHRAG